MKSVKNFPLQTSSHLLVNFYLILGPSPSPAGGLFFILFIFFPSCPGSHFQLFYNPQNFQNGFLQFSQLLTLVSYVTSHLVFIVLSHSVCVCVLYVYIFFSNFIFFPKFRVSWKKSILRICSMTCRPSRVSCSQ